MIADKEILVIDNRHTTIKPVVSMYCAKQSTGYATYVNRKGGWSMYSMKRRYCKTI